MDKQEVFEFLDNLQESGIVNMLGAGPYIQEVFGLDRFEAKELLVEWISYKQNMFRTEALLTDE